MRVQFLSGVHRRLASTQYPAIRNSLPQLCSLFQHAKRPASNKRTYALPASSRKRTPPAMTSEMTTLKGKPLNRAELDSLLRRNLFYTPSFELYGGVSGFYDYGPPGCALNANILSLWRRHFVMEENMLELDLPVITPHEVLQTSGHVDRFADWMTKDPGNGEILRADHLVENVLESRLKGDKEARGQKVEQKEDQKPKKKKAAAVQAVKLDDAVVQEYEEVLAKIDNYGGPELGELMEKYDIRNPSTGNKTTPPVEFNLMFQIPNIGPSSALRGYLRPETAQGQFLNFAKLLEYNNGRMPFASASIGKSFRNEISPRSGLLRVREFTMGEIEYFLSPDDKRHPRFQEVAHIELNLLDRDVQLSGKTTITLMPIGEAVKRGIVDNETLGYFLARIQLFLLAVGCNPSKIRFRQHMATEMAHYASDCWDAELQTSYGWIEVNGTADRSCYDLTVHMKKTGQSLQAKEFLSEPQEVEYWLAEPVRKNFGPKFRKDAPSVEAAINALSDELREKLSIELKNTGKVTIDVPGVGSQVELTNDLVVIEKQTRTDHTRSYIPSVIEPSFGIGRIFYAICEHSYWIREGEGNEARAVLSFPPSIAPIPVVLYPLSSSPEFDALIKRLSALLRRNRVHHIIDASSASIGRRYSRQDAAGTPLAITADFESIQRNTFTLRDRDTLAQVRATDAEIVDAVVNIINGDEDWASVAQRLPKFEAQEVGPDDVA
ncbi:glycyl-tRNA synthetase [Xylogone sp. PMI_703]|nr:glycyl-tRNA synthetase [Xylogone sp. PMI_703]